MSKFNNKEARTTSTVSLLLILSLTLRILVPLFLTLNIFHILHDVKYAKIRTLYWEKEKKVISLTDCKVFFLSNISPPSPPYVSPSNIGQSNLSFVRMYDQGVLTEFYGIYTNELVFYKSNDV